MESPFKRRRVPRNDSSGTELHERRVRNDLQLKSAFESIFEKYGKDFSEIGDEIDIKTGEIVVNHGHVFGMKNETDPGCEEDLYDELNPESWSSKDASKLSLKSLDKPCASAVSYSLPEERPAPDPAWRAPPLPKGCMTVQKPTATLPFNPDYTKQKRSPSPAGVSVWALNPSVVHVKKPRQKKATLPNHPKPRAILPKKKNREISSATDVPSLTRISPQPEPEQNPVRSIPLTPSFPSATSKSTTTSVWTTADDIHLKPNKSPPTSDCSHHRRERLNGFTSRDKAYDPGPEKNQHPRLLAKAQREPAIVIQSETPNSRDSWICQLLKAQTSRSNKLLNDLTMTSSARSKDKDNQQIKPCTGHLTDMSENERVIAAENTKSKQGIHVKQTETSSTLLDLDSAIITSTFVKSHGLANPKALPTPKTVLQKAACVQTEDRQSPIKLLSQPILQVYSDSYVSKVSRNTADNANEKLANDFWNPPVEQNSSREKKYDTSRMCINCSAQDSNEWFDKLCSACNQYKRRTKGGLHDSVIEPRIHSNRHSDSHELVQRSKKEIKTKASHVPLPSIATSQAKANNKLILPNRVLEMSSTPHSMVAPVRLLALEDVSEDELSTPVKTVGTKLLNSTTKTTELTKSNASISRKRPHAKFLTMNDTDELNM